MKPALSQEVQFVKFSISICFDLATLLDRVTFHMLWLLLLVDNYLFNLFHCFTRCSSSQRHSPSMPKIHSIPLLLTGSFAVDNGDHLQSTRGIICGRGSFAVQYISEFRKLSLSKLG